MAEKSTYEELEQRVKVLEKELFELKRAESELKHQKKRLESLIEFSSLAIVTLDERHNIISCNRDFEKLFYFSESEIIGINLDELITDQESIEDSRPYTKQTLRGKAIYGSGKRKRKDGANIDVEFIGVPVIIDGKVIGAYGIYQDISERKKVEDELRKSENKMRSIFRAAPIGIGVVINRYFQDVNERFCEISGYSRDELIGQSARIVYPTDEDYEYVGSAKYSMIEESGTGAVETRFRCKDGEIINVLLSSTPIDSEDLSVGVTFTALDITKRKQAEDALRESENQLRTIIEGTHALLANVDANGYFTYVNDATVRATGYARSEELIKIRPTIPVIICTGHSDRMDEGKAMKSGIAAYTMKPLVKTDLVNTVRRVLDKSKGLAR